jgi:hypothetical protein
MHSHQDLSIIKNIYILVSKNLQNLRNNSSINPNSPKIQQFSLITQTLIHIIYT